jgi:RNA polymerase sigma-70 factor, ECF subfamily
VNVALRADDVDLLRDRTLVEQFQAGDQEGFEDLYRRYYGRLYRYCLKRVGNPHEAEEVTQEAFARAFTALPRFGGERKFYPWLSVIASRLCVDTHRRGARSEPSADVDLGAVDGGQDQVFDAVDRDLLQQALARLGPRHREVLRLREEQGWSYQKIAEYYEVSLGTVEQLLLRARRALKREFAAVSGSEKGMAAGIPVIGWVLRRLGDLRLRPWTLDVAPALANGAVSMAVVVGSAAGLAAVAPDGRSPAPQPPAHHMEMVTPPPALTAPALPPAAETAPAADSAASEPAPAAAATPATVGQPSAPSPQPVEVTSAEDARDQGEAAPVRAEVEGTGGSADPFAGVNELADYLYLTGGSE